METGWTNDLDKTGLTIENIGNIVILNLGKELNVSDCSFLWTVIYGTDRKPPEWQILFNPDQLILDFSKLQYIDIVGNEFIELAENYKKVKGKEIIFCGIDEKIGNLLKLISEENYDNLHKVKSREQAIEYYLEHTNRHIIK